MNFTDCVRGTLTLGDGAWGTELQKLGAALGILSGRMESHKT